MTNQQLDTQRQLLKQRSELRTAAKRYADAIGINLTAIILQSPTGSATRVEANSPKVVR